ncbi:MAG: HupE/UreJ family protein [Verrucomicrobiaceae bacterium]|nr:HupE/UreJ family protein [Verrucomicrobiaceae bacterium]
MIVSLPRPLLILPFLFVGAAEAHPVPDVLVRSYFSSNGEAEIRVEVDPRSFEAHPEEHDYLEKTAAEKVDDKTLETMGRTAATFLAGRVRFLLEPLGEVKPEFDWSFAKLGDAPLENPDDPAVLIGSWKTTLPQGLSGFRIQSLELTDPDAIPMNVVFLNHLNGQQIERYAVLFPGEKSFLLDLTGLVAPLPETAVEAVGVTAGAGDLAAIFRSEVKRGFLHVLPLGLDHVLFVLGLFLMSRKWKPLLFQVTTFTLAHTLTLWLASAGWVELPARVVEPVIAASIVFVALENLVRRDYSHWRLVVVFVFGLIHGLGFAGVMSTRLDSTASLVVGLLGINIGVELGQLAILAIAFLATCWIASETRYRKFVVVPGSLLIALAGVWWVLERTLW